MTPEELAVKHFPYTTSCPMKRKKIDWQRENLAKEIKDHFVSMSVHATIACGGVNANSTCLSTDNLFYISKQELK